MDANADTETVFEALDALAEADLLQLRIAPPSGVTRRSLLRGLAGLSAIAATGGISLRAATASAAQGMCKPEKDALKESTSLWKDNEKLSQTLEQSADKLEKAGALKASRERRQKESRRKRENFRLRSEVEYDDGGIDE